MDYKDENMWLMQGDCLDRMKEIPDGSVDSIVTDPPYGLSFMGKKWDYDVPSAEIWAEALRVLKPGGHLLAFAGTRTQHRMAVNIEDAGFEIRDMIAWVYGSGFPKSLDVSKAIDKARREDAEPVKAVAEALRAALDASGKTRKEIDAHFGTANVSQYWFSPHRNSQVPPVDKWPWLRDFLDIDSSLDAEVWRLNGRKGKPGEAWEKREVVGERRQRANNSENSNAPMNASVGSVELITAPATEAAKQWDGWGTALKPALEPITVARKPFKGTVAANVLEHGTGAINIDGCRVGDFQNTTPSGVDRRNAKLAEFGYRPGEYQMGEKVPDTPPGRWPANIIHDGSDEVVGLFPVSKGSAARFFYCAKASKKDRNEGCEGLPQNEVYSEASVTPMRDQRQQTTRGNNHPTVKPTDLMRYLCRLVTPPNGIVLDPFMGSGSTGKAAMLEGFRFIGIELDKGYFDIAKQRIGSANDD